MKRFWLRNEKIFICLTYILSVMVFSVWAAQVAIVSTDTRQEAWAKETLNNSDLQTNIDLKADITSATLVTPNIGTPSAGVGTNLTGIPAATGLVGTAWRVFYVNGSGVIVELALGVDGTVLTSAGVDQIPAFEAQTGGGDVSASAVITDHSIVRGDGGAKGVQDSGVVIDDSDNVSGVTDLSAESVTILQGVAAQSVVLLEGSGSGTDSHTIVAQPFTADRTTTLPDYNGAIPVSTAINSSGLVLAAGIEVIAASEWLPIGWAEDGTTPPAAIAAITGTTRNKGRAFSATVNNDVTFIWQVPKDFTGSTVTIQVTGIVSAATAPANAEIIHFTAAIASWANSELSTIAEGTLQATALTADATYVQYDGLITVASSAITPAGSIAAGETCAIEVIRLAATTDTYAQLFDVTGITVNYSKQLAN